MSAPQGAAQDAAQGAAQDAPHGAPLAAAVPVRRRHVFFVSGFDPKGAAYYHRLYRTQAALQGAVTGAAYEVSERTTCPNGNAVWTVRHNDTQTRYEHVRWDDMVRAHWPRRVGQVLGDSLRLYALLLSMPRTLREVWRVANRTLVSLLYPALFWLAVVLSALVAAGCVAWLVGSAGGAGTEWVAGSVAGVAAVLAAGGVCALGWRLEGRLHTSWLLRIFCFADRHARGQVPEWSARWQALAAQMGHALRDPEVDEVLLVGFSVGSVCAVSAAARTVQACADAPQALAKLSVLTLGHCIPLFALLPRAHVLRAELACVGASREVYWVDCSSPSDWGSFALVDPVAWCAGGAGGGHRRASNPRVMVSPRFHALFEPATYAGLRHDKRRMHLQYLMAGQLPGVYDYFDWTAGAQSLRQRVWPKAVS